MVHSKTILFYTRVNDREMQLIERDLSKTIEGLMVLCWRKAQDGDDIYATKNY